MLYSITKLGIWVDTKERALPSQGIFDGKYMTTPPWDTADFQASGQEDTISAYDQSSFDQMWIRQDTKCSPISLGNPAHQ